MGLDNPLHIAFLLVVMLMVFGAKRLPEMGKSLGTGLRGFKESLNTDAPPSALAMGEHPEPVAVPVAEHHSTERAAA
ncbi:MAG TPA: twin-arginine translocase TatA/TatE family subunit [Solirubrobacteraceae bacterium]|jgi:sec-independent protein translocase protein TatA|nr:twin-arginine translocase TatA/TatE family subunit [Solirubrobacteraceae bacterium]